MTDIVRDVHIAAPPEAVFAVLCHAERLPEFSDMTVAVRGPGRPLQELDRFEQTIRVAGVEIETDWQVVELRPEQLLRVEGRSRANGTASVTDRLVPDGRGTRLTLEVRYEPPLGLLGDLVDKLVVERRSEEDAETILRRLKDLCEGVPVP